MNINNLKLFVKDELLFLEPLKPIYTLQMFLISYLMLF